MQYFRGVDAACIKQYTYDGGRDVISSDMIYGTLGAVSSRPAISTWLGVIVMVIAAELVFHPRGYVRVPGIFGSRVGFSAAEKI